MWTVQEPVSPIRQLDRCCQFGAEDICNENVTEIIRNSQFGNCRIRNSEHDVAGDIVSSTIAAGVQEITEMRNYRCRPH